jgi:hypothetical protein
LRTAIATCAQRELSDILLAEDCGLGSVDFKRSAARGHCDIIYGRFRLAIGDELGGDLLEHLFVHEALKPFDLGVGGGQFGAQIGVLGAQIGQLVAEFGGVLVGLRRFQSRTDEQLIAIALDQVLVVPDAPPGLDRIAQVVERHFDRGRGELRPLR